MRLKLPYSEYTVNQLIFPYIRMSYSDRINTLSCMLQYTYLRTYSYERTHRAEYFHRTIYGEFKSSELGTTRPLSSNVCISVNAPYIGH